MFQVLFLLTLFTSLCFSNDLNTINKNTFIISDLFNDDSIIQINDPTISKEPLILKNMTSMKFFQLSDKNQTKFSELKSFKKVSNVIVATPNYTENKEGFDLEIIPITKYLNNKIENDNNISKYNIKLECFQRIKMEQIPISNLFTIELPITSKVNISQTITVKNNVLNLNDLKNETLNRCMNNQLTFNIDNNEKNRITITDITTKKYIQSVNTTTYKQLNNLIYVIIK